MGVVVPPAPSAEPPETPEPAEAGPEEVVTEPGLPPVEPPSTPERLDTGPEEVAVEPTLPLVEPPGSPQPEYPVVDETAPLLPEDDSEGEQPRPDRRESETRYWRRAGWRWGIGAAVLAASLAGPGVYWLKGKYQRDLTEIQQAYLQEKAHAERLAAELARLRKELDEARE